LIDVGPKGHLGLTKRLTEDENYKNHTPAKSVSKEIELRD